MSNMFTEATAAPPSTVGHYIKFFVLHVRARTRPLRPSTVTNCLQCLDAHQPLHTRVYLYIAFSPSLYIRVWFSSAFFSSSVDTCLIRELPCTYQRSIPNISSKYYSGKFYIQRLDHAANHAHTRRTRKVETKRKLNAVSILLSLYTLEH